METGDTELRERLQAALGGRYALERELGGGGMARVFVAVEAALGRRVVIKVLPPDATAAVSADRFRREIRLAASLQHPHVVPLLSAGEAAGLLYYTMPYVDGESLRARLTREGPLPVGDVVRVLREVADALGAAHEAGVVHRDIKPDNILLARGHAVVTDFGVARALGAAGADDARAATGAEASTPASTALTARGFVLGTPAYMAPEQAAGDGAVDARADFYALGVVAYEMLAGAHPFAGRSPVAMLVAHAMAAPEPLAERRPGLPPRLAALTAQLLEKRPADRPQGAAEVLAALDAVATGEPDGPAAAASAAPAAAADRTTGPVTPGRPTRRRAWRGIGAAVLAVGLAAGAFWKLRTHPPNQPQSARTRVLVDLFENRTGDPALDPLGQMASDWVVRGLSETKLVDVVDVSTATALARAGAPPGADTATGRDRLLRVAGATRAGTLVVGRYYRRGDSLEFQAQVIDARGGGVLRSVQPAAGLAAAPGTAVGTLRSRVMASLAALVDPELAAWPASGFRDPPSYEVYRELQWGNQLFYGGDFQGAITHFARAERLDSSVVPTARFMRALSYMNVGARATTDSLLASIGASATQPTSLESTSREWLAAAVRGDRVGAYEHSRAAAALAPNTPPHLQFAAEALAVGRLGEALAAVRAIDPDAPSLRGWPFAWGTRARVLHAAGRYADELVVVRQAQTRIPANSGLVFGQVTALAGLGRTAELAAVLDEAGSRAAAQPAGHVELLGFAVAELRAHGHAAAARTVADGAVAWTRARLRATPAGPPARPPVSRGVDALRGALAYALYVAGDWAGARAIVEPTSAADANDFPRLATAGLTAAHLGDTTAAHQYDQRLARIRTPYLDGEPTYQRACIAAVLGERERAVALLREAFAQGLHYGRLHTEIDFEGLRGYAPFDALARPRD